MRPKTKNPKRPKIQNALKSKTPKTQNKKRTYFVLYRLIHLLGSSIASLIDGRQLHSTQQQNRFC